MKTTKRKNTEIFINECMEIRGNKYDYSLVSYKNNKEKVKIICKDHGIFEQTPNNHLNKLQDCPKCSTNYFEIKNTTEVINNFINKHGNKYDYSKVEYNGNKIKVEIICKKHGSFYQTPNNHLKGQDCPICKKIDINTFIQRANIKHNNKYDYSLSEYENMNSKVKIICQDHGVFKQIAHSHIYGSGCPTCKDSKGEREIKILLDEYKINYIKEYSFIDCKLINKLRFDFYLPEKNTCIEFDGEHHFRPIEYYGGEVEFKKIIKRDKIKSDFCKKNNINLIRVRYDDNIKNKISECLL